jgi:two-component system nitrate/nitrite response regulator NarL
LAEGRDDPHIVEAVRLGVQGVFLKEMSPYLLVRCIRTVARGQQWAQRVSGGRLVEKLLQRQAAGQHAARELTNRELEILRLVATGLRNKAIAAQLSVTEGTVKIHLHHIFEKLQVHGRVRLILYARETGLA